MAKLLVSVRSAPEALAAWRGGASIIDVKEPSRGSLGRSDVQVWREARSILPEHAPMSVALGELADWDWDGGEFEDRAVFRGIAYRKIGFAGLGEGEDFLAQGRRSWAASWRRLRDRLGDGSAWIGAAYADWERAGAPAPDRILDEVFRSGAEGVLLDTWDKTRPFVIDRSWLTDWVARARSEGVMTAVAGRLDESSIARLAPADPDVFAVRGAACAGGDRDGPVEVERVARLARAAAGLRSKE